MPRMLTHGRRAEQCLRATTFSEIVLAIVVRATEALPWRITSARLDNDYLIFNQLLIGVRILRFRHYSP